MPEPLNSDRMPEKQDISSRILDATATLLVRWGYSKITMDDIAKQAGVAKATVYLRWKTREALFGALMKRERLECAQDIRQRTTTDPAGTTLRGLLKHSALALMQRPVLKAALLRDMEMLGKWAHHERSGVTYMERLVGFKTYLEVLREQQLVRVDLSLQAQVFMFSAIFMGFFLVAPLMPDEFTPSDEEMAELMAETVHRSLEPEHAASPAALQTVSHTFQQYLDRVLEIMQEQFQQEMKS